MLTLRSQYSDTNLYKSQATLTVGICDYIPHQYFSKQHFTIYIQSVPHLQIIKSILWNQYYEKTLLKQIYSQLLNNNSTKRNENEFVAKLDGMLFGGCKSSYGEVVYLKVGASVYNLKDKLEYSACKELQQQILKCQSLTVQKITKQGKWKKIFISFAPYYNKSEVDITLTLDQQHQQFYTSIIETPNQTATKTKTKKHPQQRNVSVVMSEKKHYRNVQSSANKNQSPRREKTKSKWERKSPATQKKSSATGEKGQDVGDKLNQISQNQIISNSFEKSLQKKIQLFQHQHTQSQPLKEINFNSTEKLSSSQHNFGNFIQSESTAPAEFDLKRKEMLKIQQHSIMNETTNMFGSDSQRLKSLNDQTKNNSVMAQILAKKEEVILNQKKKMQQMEKRHQQQIEELRLKHLKETQTFKTEISQILNQYSKKYENQKQESKQLRLELSSIQQILTENKIAMAELQITSKFNSQQASKFRTQGNELKEKLIQLEQKYNALKLKSREEQLKLVNERDGALGLAEKYKEKYNALAKKLKVLIAEQQLSLKE